MQTYDLGIKPTNNPDASEGETTSAQDETESGPEYPEFSLQSGSIPANLKPGQEVDAKLRVAGVGEDGSLDIQVVSITCDPSAGEDVGAEESMNSYFGRDGAGRKMATGGRRVASSI